MKIKASAWILSARVVGWWGCVVVVVVLLVRGLCFMGIIAMEWGGGKGERKRQKVLAGDHSSSPPLLVGLPLLAAAKIPSMTGL